MGKLEVESAKDLGFHFEYILTVFSVDPVLEVRGVDFLIFHGDKKTGLGGRNSLKLVLDDKLTSEEEVKVVDCEVESGPEQVEASVDLEHVADQVDAHLG
jgi:hypothetical protein